MFHRSFLFLQKNTTSQKASSVSYLLYYILNKNLSVSQNLSVSTNAQILGKSEYRRGAYLGTRASERSF